VIPTKTDSDEEMSGMSEGGAAELGVDVARAAFTAAIPTTR